MPFIYIFEIVWAKKFLLFVEVWAKLLVQNYLSHTVIQSDHYIMDEINQYENLVNRFVSFTNCREVEST